MTILSHITGTPGSGKTYIGNMLKKYSNKIKIIDTDDWRDLFYNNKNISKLNNKVNKLEKNKDKDKIKMN